MRFLKDEFSVDCSKNQSNDYIFCEINLEVWIYKKAPKTYGLGAFLYISFNHKSKISPKEIIENLIQHYAIQFFTIELSYPMKKTIYRYHCLLSSICPKYSIN